MSAVPKGRSGDRGLDALVDYLRQNRGIDLTGYKRTTLGRRIARRMQVAKVESFADYIDYLEVHPEEFSILFNTILIKVTSFFRDPQAWEKLRTTAVPAIVESKTDDDPIRVWSAGC